MTVNNNSVINQANNDNIDLMTRISKDIATQTDIDLLTSKNTNNQLKVFLIAQARNELSRVVKMTEFLDKVENKFMNKVEEGMNNNELSLEQYSDIISVITSLLARSNNIISKILNDDSLSNLLITTVHTNGNSISTTSVVSNLKDAHSRERVRTVIQQILSRTNNYPNDTNTTTIVYEENQESEDENNEQ